MKVELTARFVDEKKSKEEKEYDKTQSLIDPDYIPEKKVRYTYDPLIIDLEDVKAWVRIDNMHTQLNMKDKDMYIIRLPYLYFSQLYEELTNTNIKLVTLSQKEVQLPVLDALQTKPFQQIILEAEGEDDEFNNEE